MLDQPRKGTQAPDPLQSDVGRPEPVQETTGSTGIGQPGGPVVEGGPGSASTV